MYCKICKKDKPKLRGCVCNQCRYLTEKERDPIGLAFRRLKAHAKQRGKEFNLTKEDFILFCVKSEYILESGISKNNFHIDRVDETKGYSIDNIQVLTNSENVRKYAKWVSRDQNGKCEFTTISSVPEKNNLPRRHTFLT